MGSRRGECFGRGHWTDLLQIGAPLALIHAAIGETVDAKPVPLARRVALAIIRPGRGLKIRRPLASRSRRSAMLLLLCVLLGGGLRWVGALQDVLMAPHSRAR